VRPQRGWRRRWVSYCCPTANPPTSLPRSSLFSSYLQGKRRADERTRTAYPCSLRVMHHASQGCARGCKSRTTYREVSLLCLAQRCTVLRSQWCRSGVNTAHVASTPDRGSHATCDILRLGLVALAYWIGSPQTMQPLISRILRRNFREWVIQEVHWISSKSDLGPKLIDLPNERL
jgi:hypothetical protein